jgi:hypothetical protein
LEPTSEASHQQDTAQLLQDHHEVHSYVGLKVQGCLMVHSKTVDSSDQVQVILS